MHDSNCSECDMCACAFIVYYVCITACVSMFESEALS